VANYQHKLRDMLEFVAPDGGIPRMVLLTPGVVTSEDPAPVQPGMVTMWMDAEGHLQWLQIIPPEVDPAASDLSQTQTQHSPTSASELPPAAKVDWTPLFAAAGLDAAQLQPASPKWLSLAAFDTRAAWDGKWPQSGYPLHVEAAAWRGKPVYFTLVSPWTRPNRTPTDADNGNAGNIIELIVAIITLFVGVWFAIRNLDRGRGDRRRGRTAVVGRDRQPRGRVLATAMAVVEGRVDRGWHQRGATHDHRRADTRPAPLANLSRWRPH